MVCSFWFYIIVKVCVYDHTTHHRPIGKDHGHSDPCGYGGHLNSHSTINSVIAHEVYFLVGDRNHLILILSNHEHSSRNTSVFEGAITSIIHTANKYRRIVVQIIDNPLSYLWEVLLLKMFDKIISLYLTECCKNTCVNLTTD